MRRVGVAALALALAGGPAAAQVADGVYEVGGCIGPGAERRIELRGGQLRFLESVCQLGPGVPLPGIEGAMLHAGSCAGEGSTWSRNYVLMPGFDGALVLMGSGWADTYRRCGP